MMLSYVLRLGQRVVQHNEAPILLTGFQALNKLLGTNVYAPPLPPNPPAHVWSHGSVCKCRYESNLQLGGPEVMGGNGVAHLLVDSDFEAIGEVVKCVSWDRNV